MRAITSGVKVVDGLLGKRFCLLLLFVFFCAIDRSSTIDATTRRATSALSFRHPRNLTKEQRDSAVTIELSGIDRNNRTAVDIARREIRRKILELLNRRKSISASPTHSTTTASNTTTVATTTTAATTTAEATTTTSATATTSTPTTFAPSSTITTTPTTTATSTTTYTTTTITPITTPTSTIITTSTTPMTTAAALTTTTTPLETTTQTPTTVAPTTETTQSTTATQGIPDVQRKRRRRNSGGKRYIFTEDDLPFVDNDPEIQEDGNLRIAILIGIKGFGDLDLNELLYEAANALDKSGELGAVPQIPVNIYKGLPKELSPVEASQLGLNFWVPILLASTALLLIFIFIFVRYWKTRNRKTAGSGETDQFLS